MKHLVFSLLRQHGLSIFISLSFLVPFVVYISTLAPSVTFGDSGELITAAATLGISHPPGSPLWTILAHLFTYIPYGSIAWRVNLASAFFAAATSFVLFRTIRLLVPSSFAALTGALSFALSYSVWGFAVVSEVYTLNALLFTLILYCLMQFHLTRKKTWLYGCSLVFGLGLTNHYIFFLIAPVLAIWVIVEHPILLHRWKTIATLVLLILAGLLVYVYIPIRAHANPAINWGNPSTWNSFIRYVTRKQLAAANTAPDVSFGINVPVSLPGFGQVPNRLISSVLYIASALRTTYPGILLIFSGIGLAALLFRSRRNDQSRSLLFLTLSLGMIASIGYAFLLGVSSALPDTRFPEYFFLFVIVSFFTGYGAYFLSSLFRKKHFLSILTSSAILFVVIVVPLMRYYRSNDWSNNTVARDHGMNILNSLPENAVLIVNKNLWTFPVLYLLKVERVRPDVTVFDRSGNVFERMYTNYTGNINDENALEAYRQTVDNQMKERFPNRPVYFAADKDFENVPREEVPEGILYRTKEAPARTVVFEEQYKNILSTTRDLWNNPDTSYILSYYHIKHGDEMTDKNSKLSEYEKAFTFGKNNPVALTTLAALYSSFDQTEKAIELTRRSLVLRPESAVTHHNLGVLYQQTKQLDEAIAEYLAALALEPTRLSTRLILAKLYLETGNCAEAEDQYNKFMNQSPIRHIFSNNIGICWARKNEFGKAKYNWQKALGAKPDYEEAKDNLSRLERFNK